MSKQVPLHYKISEKVMELVREGRNQKVVAETVRQGKIERENTNAQSFQVGGEIFISSSDIYSGLKINAIKLVIRIQQELEMNNPLWECVDKHKTEVRRAIAQLRRANILDPIDGTDIYIVNPAKIRKGRPLAVYGALHEYAKRMWERDKSWKPTTEDIRRLRSPDTVLLQSGYEIIPNS